MESVCRILPTTDTYPVLGQRRYHWLAMPGELGKLAICQGERESETYRVEEDCSAPFPARVWMLNRETGKITLARLGTYQVQLDPSGWSCTCKGYVAHDRMEKRAALAEGREPERVHCKHTHSVRSLHRFGDLNPELPVIDLPSEAEIDDMAVLAGVECPSAETVDGWR